MTRDEIEAALSEILAMSEGRAKLAMLQRVIEAADSMNELEIGYRLRLELMSTALRGGRGDELAAAFSWCLSQYDRSPERFQDTEWQILWRFRWVISTLVNYHQVPKAQIEALLEDMTRRYERAGISLRAVHLLKLNIGLDIWDKKTVAAVVRQLYRTPRDHYSDDPNTELSFAVRYEIDCGRYQRAAELGKKFLEGSFVDEYHSASVRTNMAVPFLLLGEPEKALICHKTAIKYAKMAPPRVQRIARHMNFLTMTDNTKESRKLFTSTVAEAIEWNSPWTQMEFFAAGTFLFERLARTGDKPVKMRLPVCFPHRNEKGLYVPSTLAKQLRADTKQLVDIFSTRNGNRFASHYLRDLATYHKHITPLALNTSN